MDQSSLAVGWILEAEQRRRLLEKFPPRYGRPIAHHVTLLVDPGRGSLPPRAEGAIVGRADDGRGVEAMVVRINGKAERPDGGTFHLTWSLADGRAAKESNAVIAKGWTRFDEPVALILTPGRF